MPSKSEKQKKLMDAVAHNKEFADKVGIPQEVGKHFVDADKEEAKKLATDKANKSNQPKE